LLHVIKVSDTLCRTTLDDGSTRRKDLYLNKTQDSQETSMSPGDSNPQSQQASGRRPTR